MLVVAGAAGPALVTAVTQAVTTKAAAAACG